MSIVKPILGNHLLGQCLAILPYARIVVVGRRTSLYTIEPVHRDSCHVIWLRYHVASEGHA
jgi:hypothetical protein